MKKQSAVTLGVRQSARVAAKRAVKSTVDSTNVHPAVKVMAIAALGALASFVINKNVKV